MGRLPFLNLSFIVLVLTVMMATQKMAPETYHSEDDFSEFSESAPQVHGPFVRPNDDYIRQVLPPSLARIAGRFAQAWQRAQILAEWPIESNSTQWEKSYAPTLVEKELIEARFHVANAEVYEWSIKNRQKTVAELNQAERFLQDARPLVKKPALATVERVTKELELMKTDTTGEGATQPANYETIKMDLDRVIGWVRAPGL
jgi:hypothetical protein